MMASQVWEKVFQSLKYCQHLQAIDVPREMGTFPQTLCTAETHERSQPAKEVSVVSVTPRHGAPNTCPCDRNYGFFHTSKAHKHRRVTLIMRNGLEHFDPETPLQGSHVQQAKSYHVGRSCHQTQRLLKKLHSETLAFSHSLDCHKDRPDTSRRQTYLHLSGFCHFGLVLFMVL